MALDAGPQSFSARSLLLPPILGAPWLVAGLDFLLEHLLDASQRLPGSLFVLDQGKAHVLVSVFPKADTWADRDLGFCQELLGKLERAHGFVSFRDQGPSEHRRLGHRYLPAQLI